jgi:hypothetical protein
VRGALSVTSPQPAQQTVSRRSTGRAAVLEVQANKKVAKKVRRLESLRLVARQPVAAVRG